MKRPSKIWIRSIVGVLLLVASGYAYEHSLAYVRAAPEDRHGLWLAALKGFQGCVRYVGSIGDDSYFRAGDLFCSRYKAPTASLHLPSTFPLGEREPYSVTSDMVPAFP